LKQKVTIVLPISRVEYLAQVFAYLELMDCDAGNTNIITIVDGDTALYIDARNRTEQSKFAERLCIQYEDLTQESKTSILGRRLRISDIHNQVKKHIGKCDYVLGIEDDTLIPKSTVTRLLQDFTLFPHAGFITGLELGRWGITYAGAWLADDLYNPQLLATIPQPDKETAIQEIDAAGFYCFMTTRENYVTHLFQPYDNNALGPDVNFGMELRRLGFMNYIDFRVNCIHRNGNESISYPKYPMQRVQFTKEESGWKQNIL